jgi:regulator of replication initiation timing
MNNKTTDKRIAALNKASQKKRQEALIKTQTAINNLVKNQQKITIRSVAREAKVSVSYIYKYPEISDKIQNLRDAQKYQPNDAITSLPKANIDNTKLIKEIAQLKAYIHNIENKKKSISELQKENIDLQIENQELKKELEFVKQNLAEMRNFILSQSHDDLQPEIKNKTRKSVAN